MNRGKRYKATMLDKEKKFYIIGVSFLTLLIIFIFALSGYKAKKEDNHLKNLIRAARFAY